VTVQETPGVSGPIKKDALYWGIVITFGSFILMIVWMVFDSYKTRQEKKEVEALIASLPSDEIQAQPRDFSRLKVLAGGDGRSMVLVPEGTFRMGSSEAEGDTDELPPRIIFLPSFYIDLHEVTFSDFGQFIEATRFPPPVVPVFQDDLSLITGPDLPVVGVSWDQARAYCEWAGKRLPTEAEWEKAARGELGPKWPWGDRFEDRWVNAEGPHDGFKYAAAPGRFEGGRSPYGLYDAAGNVAEWVEDWYDPLYYKDEDAPFQNPKGPKTGKHRVYRGGSWNDSSANVRTAKRFAAAPHQSSAVIGFRCAMDVS
jgi:formylglycine-generating enzyme required for sulfatase activity